MCCVQGQRERLSPPHPGVVCPPGDTMLVLGTWDAPPQTRGWHGPGERLSHREMGDTTRPAPALMTVVQEPWPEGKGRVDGKGALGEGRIGGRGAVRYGLFCEPKNKTRQYQSQKAIPP